MGHWIEARRNDGTAVRCYRANAVGDVIGDVVIVQEIFGVNEHIRNVCERYAQAGFNALAPALFDRVEPDIELDYTPDGIARGRAVMSEIPTADAIADIAAAVDACGSMKPAVVGFCWGGTLAFAAATQIGDKLSCAVSYYGGGVANLLNSPPRCPVLFHFGEKDQSIPAETIDAVRKALPDAPLYTYDAGHGFSCDARASYEPESAARAFERTISFLKANARG
ncbi:carboxymethylenebutenolidase [Agaricicola taiwanensis]|uniref:Carboxymethylenebutenolidase n=1 Tax=Agaricicola taiwanensis TaxID=591372 RepID=A0A8J2YIV1_9RHOB|nr:dienelactone hydrolase family protein [Agaricicola taiwanensis]GGE46260.1 carboxymethylenebutenolidase [Agaricicola taiwanensis]